MSTASPGSPVTRRRRTASVSDPLKKVTVHLHASVSVAITRLVNQGAAASQGAFIEAAVLAKLREMRREKVYAAYAEAAADTGFMAEMSNTLNAFDTAIADGFEA